MSSRSVDVRRREDLVALVRLAQREFGRVDVLAGNAGIGPISVLDELRVGDWDAMIDVNLRGLMYGIAAALPVFRAQGHGPWPVGEGPGGDPRGGVDDLSGNRPVRGRRQEAGPTIRVSMVSPGFVASDFIDTVPDGELRERMAATRDDLALPPAAVARAIRFAIEQPDGVDVNEVVIRSTAQG